MSRRRGSATALKASEVVAARAMQLPYIPIWEYVKHFFWHKHSRNPIGQNPWARSGTAFVSRAKVSISPGAAYDSGLAVPTTQEPEGQPMAHRFTIGVEEEFQIIDPATCELRSHVMQLVSSASPDIIEQVKQEMHQSIVETGTKICENVSELRIDMHRTR